MIYIINPHYQLNYQSNVICHYHIVDQISCNIITLLVKYHVTLSRQCWYHNWGHHVSLIELPLRTYVEINSHYIWVWMTTFNQIVEWRRIPVHSTFDSWGRPSRNTHSWHEGKHLVELYKDPIFSSSNVS